MTTQNLWNATIAVLRAKFIAIQSYLKKQEKQLIDNLTLHLKQPEKEEEKNPKLQELFKKIYHSKNQQSQKLVL